MVTRVSPQEYYGIVETPEPVVQSQPVQAFLEPVPLMNDQAFKYIVVIGITIIGIAALKYILKK